MATSPDEMGGILDMATTQSDGNIFSNDHHKDSNHHEEKHTFPDYQEAWANFDDEPLIKNDESEKASSPDIINSLGWATGGMMSSIGSAMMASTGSSCADTPGDSGVLCLDSEASELSECPAIMTLSLDLPADSLLPEADACGNLPDVLQTTQNAVPTEEVVDNLNKERRDSVEAIKSTSDDIVYRRKCKKKLSNQSQPKKRVSFHEDILNNTKTDNIHIEHGFVSYRTPGEDRDDYTDWVNQSRFSWCAVGDSPYFRRQQSSVCRETKSDVLTYGTTDVTNSVPFDNSGVYEYENDGKCVHKPTCTNKVSACKCSKDNSPSELYMCSCSSSDSNLSSESESSSQTISSASDTRILKFPSMDSADNTQKSYSCDCIEKNIKKSAMRTMYFSEADINRSDENAGNERLQLSEILPKASCLKKSALKKNRYIKTDIIEDHLNDNASENKITVRNLLDSKNLFGSLKSIYKNINFGLAIAERGLPEGAEDCQSVLEVLPQENNTKNSVFTLSKSLDTSSNDNFAIMDCKETRMRGDGHSKNFTHDVDNQLRRKCSIEENVKPTIMNMENIASRPKQNLSLDMKAGNYKTVIDWKTQDQNSNTDSRWARSKYVVNCESTVYEHKGVSYCYEYDAFQTTFDTSKDTFTPISDSIKADKGQLEPIKETSIAEVMPDKMTVSTDSEFLLLSDDQPQSTMDLMSENDFPSEAADPGTLKSKFIQYLIDNEDTSKGTKHLSSPTKKRGNKMRYNNFAKPEDDCGSDYTPAKRSSKSEESTEEDSSKKGMNHRAIANMNLKKAYQTKLKNNKFFQNKMRIESCKYPKLIRPLKVPPECKMSAMYLNHMINKEVMENKRVSVKLMTADEPSYFDSFEENVAIECCEKLKLELFGDRSEVLHRMLKVRSAYCHENGEWTPLLVFITDRALYVADVEVGKTSYDLKCYLTHNLLDVIVLGPDSQYVEVWDKAGECKCVLITGDRYLTHRLVSSLEWSSRNSSVYPGMPAIMHRNRDSLKRSLMHVTSVDKMERCVFSGMVGSSCPGAYGNGSRPTKDSAPSLTGFLMYKTNNFKHWQASFFLLKSGVLYYGSGTPPSDPLSAQSLPNSIQLDRVVGVRRCTDAQGRPHCFELALNSSGLGNVGNSELALQMAAPDDDTASQWLQGLLMHAAQALEGPSKKTLPPCCTLLATSQHIVTMREQLVRPNTIARKNCEGLYYPQEINKSVEILSCASIKDLTAFKIPDNDDNWCILEFIFCEVREGSEMGFLFGSSAELERFISTVETLWHSINDGVFPISVLSQLDVVSGRCSGWQKRLVTAWDRLLPSAHR